MAISPGGRPADVLPDDILDHPDFHYPRENWTDLGLGTWIRFYSDQQDEHAVGVGLIELHRTPQGAPCAGSILFDIPENAPYVGAPMWTVESRDPLTLSPSLLCTACGHHGFIRGGRWVEA